MTISNSNLLSALPVSLEMPVDSMLSGKMDAKLMELETLDQPFMEGDFWSMLSQQLTEINQQEGLKSFGSKDLFSLFEGSEAAAEADIRFTIGGEVGLEVKIQSMITLNSLPEEGLTDLELDIDVSQQVMTQLIQTSLDEDQALVPAHLAAIHLQDLDINKRMLDGDKLPLSRQSVSSILPQQIATVEMTLSQKPIEQPTTIFTASSLDAESEAKLMPLRSAELVAKNSEHADMDKSQFRQVVMEQVQPATKENSAIHQAQINLLSTVIPQSQAHSSQPLTASLQTLQIPPQATPSQWGEAMGERVTFLLNNKLNSAEIRIDPPHLGKLDIQIQVKDDSASILINTQHAHTRELIESASVRLRDFLQESGYSSVDVNVSHREQSMEQGTFAENEDEHGSDNQTSQLASLDDSADDHLEIHSLLIDSGKIDYFV